MRVEGRWHLFRDGALRPVIDAVVQTPDGDWQPVLFLLGSGADRTVFNADFLSLLELMALPESETPQLGGVGGKAESIFVGTRLSFVRDDGKQVKVQGSFGVFTDPHSSDVSVLGRDVTDNFDVIYSFPKRQVTLLASPHSFQIEQAN